MKPFIRTLLIDDEKSSTENLKTLLEAFCPEVDVVNTANSAIEGVSLIKEEQPDLVFLDISMPHANGFEVLATFSDRQFDVIFLTAHQEYAIKAIREQAFDYLLKPISVDDIQRVIKKYVQDKQEKEAATPKKEKLRIPVQDGMLFIDLEEIVMLKGDGSYTTFTMTNQREVVASKHLKHFSDCLPYDQFFRTHQSYIINIDAVEKYSRNDGGIIYLKGGKTAELSRSKKEAFFNLVG